MPIDQTAAIEITAFGWVPDGAKGLVKDLRVRWALEEACLPYRVRLLDPRDRPTDYVQQQPFNQVPYLLSPDIELFESGAILQYVGEQAEALLPREARGRYAAIQWLHAALSSVEPFVQRRVLLDSIYANEEWAKLSKPSADELSGLRLRQVSERLGDRKWLEDDRFTIGDLMMVTVLRIADRGKLLEPFPNLGAYVARGQERPAFARALTDHLGDFDQTEGLAA
ncbi:glutathione S-transferase family protein [Sphingomonas piscis]|uniref:Glutathione S-transferase family protein n=1 Tax=Sphingomonas piscis TaxID=2714943 RepID=A0A6G7YQE7_9SPHN|nr:glutathione S-transferase family protein [Sphingomonas piscis]QIK78963.1 glutathione S-transferase family protein [Sphingomonas piscis]